MLDEEEEEDVRDTQRRIIGKTRIHQVPVVGYFAQSKGNGLTSWPS